MNILNLFLYTIPFWAPLLVGMYLLMPRRNRFSRMAGLFTLKPILATPLWLAVLSNEAAPVTTRLFASILPGIILTGLIVFTYRDLFAGSQARSAHGLLALDCLRWLISAALLVTGATYNASTSTWGMMACLFALIGLTMPTVYSVAAILISVVVYQDKQVGRTV